MNRSFEDFDESEIPIEDSDSIKSVRLGISHQHNNILINNKGRIKEEDLLKFGIETVSDNSDKSIESGNFK